VDQLDEEYPIRLTTGRRIDDFNTGVQTREYASPLRRKEALDVSPEDGQRYELRDGEKVRVTSRRGSLVAPVRFDSALRPGLAFLSVHDHDQVATNELTIDAVDPKSGTSEFKATAIRIEKV
jgi:predicted molibdopterin-dependent oxidoreductase YjgC